MNIWDQLLMSRQEFRDHPQRDMLIRRVRGIKIFDCCEQRLIAKIMKNPMQHLIDLFEAEQKAKDFEAEDKAFDKAQRRYDNKTEDSLDYLNY